MDFATSVNEFGYAIVEEGIDEQAVSRLRDEFAELPDVEEVRRKTNVYGVRNLLALSEATRNLASNELIGRLVGEVLGSDAYAVRATLFDKVPDANWNLRYHQDSVISVKTQIESEGYAGWSRKGDVWQVRPPVGVLKQMLAIRVHLDDCSETNGALRILPGTHKQRWPRPEISECREHFTEVTAELKCGGILAMRPLVLHASSASTSPEHRRVVHIEYANIDLPNELEWHRKIPIAKDD